MSLMREAAATAGGVRKRAITAAARKARRQDRDRGIGNSTL
jgi:hypothetical protein